ncbi:hypothetical protein ABBQ32_008855 [Trebouxia sp. C0010 RCD-2024]
MQQVDLMRVLSVPQLATGTVDLVRGHPLLTDRKPIWLNYAGQREVRLDNVELQGHEEADLSGEQYSAQWFAQGDGKAAWSIPFRLHTFWHQHALHCMLQSLGCRWFGPGIAV